MTQSDSSSSSSSSSSSNSSSSSSSDSSSHKSSKVRKVSKSKSTTGKHRKLDGSKKRSKKSNGGQGSNEEEAVACLAMEVPAEEKVDDCGEEHAVIPVQDSITNGLKKGTEVDTVIAVLEAENEDDEVEGRRGSEGKGTSLPDTHTEEEKAETRVTEILTESNTALKTESEEDEVDEWEGIHSGSEGEGKVLPEAHLEEEKAEISAEEVEDDAAVAPEEVANGERPKGGGEEEAVSVHDPHTLQFSYESYEEGNPPADTEIPEQEPETTSDGSNGDAVGTSVEPAKGKSLHREVESGSSRLNEESKSYSVIASSLLEVAIEDGVEARNVDNVGAEGENVAEREIVVEEKAETSVASNNDDTADTSEKLAKVESLKGDDIGESLNDEKEDIVFLFDKRRRNQGGGDAQLKPLEVKVVSGTEKAFLYNDIEERSNDSSAPEGSLIDSTAECKPGEECEDAVDSTVDESKTDAFVGTKERVTCGNGSLFAERIIYTGSPRSDIETQRDHKSQLQKKYSRQVSTPSPPKYVRESTSIYRIVMALEEGLQVGEKCIHGEIDHGLCHQRKVEHRASSPSPLRTSRVPAEMGVGKGSASPPAEYSGSCLKEDGVSSKQPKVAPVEMESSPFDVNVVVPKGKLAKVTLDVKGGTGAEEWSEVKSVDDQRSDIEGMMKFKDGEKREVNSNISFVHHDSQSESSSNFTASSTVETYTDTVVFRREDGFLPHSGDEQSSTAPALKEILDHAEAEGSVGPRLKIVHEFSAELIDDVYQHEAMTLTRAGIEGEYEVERILRLQKTHDLLCPVCHSCITKRVILRKRKRTVVEETEAVDEDIIEENVRDNVVEEDNAVEEYEDWGCLACFTFLFRREKNTVRTQVPAVPGAPEATPPLAPVIQPTVPSVIEQPREVQELPLTPRDARADRNCLPLFFTWRRKTSIADSDISAPLLRTDEDQSPVAEEPVSSIGIQSRDLPVDIQVPSAPEEVQIPVVVVESSEDRICFPFSWRKTTKTTSAGSDISAPLLRESEDQSLISEEIVSSTDIQSQESSVIVQAPPALEERQNPVVVVESSEDRICFPLLWMRATKLTSTEIDISTPLLRKDEDQSLVAEELVSSMGIESRELPVDRQAPLPVDEVQIPRVVVESSQDRVCFPFSWKRETRTTQTSYGETSDESSERSISSQPEGVLPAEASGMVEGERHRATLNCMDVCLPAYPWGSEGVAITREVPQGPISVTPEVIVPSDGITENEPQRATLNCMDVFLPAYPWGLEDSATRKDLSAPLLRKDTDQSLVAEEPERSMEIQSSELPLDEEDWISLERTSKTTSVTSEVSNSLVRKDEDQSVVAEEPVSSMGIQSRELPVDMQDLYSRKRVINLTSTDSDISTPLLRKDEDQRSVAEELVSSMATQSKELPADVQASPTLEEVQSPVVVVESSEDRICFPFLYKRGTKITQISYGETSDESRERISSHQEGVLPAEASGMVEGERHRATLNCMDVCLPAYPWGSEGVAISQEVPQVPISVKPEVILPSDGITEDEPHRATLNCMDVFLPAYPWGLEDSTTRKQASEIPKMPNVPELETVSSAAVEWSQVGQFVNKDFKVVSRQKKVIQAEPEFGSVEKSTIITQTNTEDDESLPVIELPSNVDEKEMSGLQKEGSNCLPIFLPTLSWRRRQNLKSDDRLEGKENVSSASETVEKFKEVTESKEEEDRPLIRKPPKQKLTVDNVESLPVVETEDRHLPDDLLRNETSEVVEEVPEVEVSRSVVKDVTQKYREIDTEVNNEVEETLIKKPSSQKLVEVEVEPLPTGAEKQYPAAGVTKDASLPEILQTDESILWEQYPGNEIEDVGSQTSNLRSKEDKSLPGYGRPYFREDVKEMGSWDCCLPIPIYSLRTTHTIDGGRAVEKGIAPAVAESEKTRDIHESVTRKTTVDALFTTETTTLQTSNDTADETHKEQLDSVKKDKTISHVIASVDHDQGAVKGTFVLDDTPTFSVQPIVSNQLQEPTLSPQSTTEKLDDLEQGKISEDNTRGTSEVLVEVPQTVPSTTIITEDLDISECRCLPQIANYSMWPWGARSATAEDTQLRHPLLQKDDNVHVTVEQTHRVTETRNIPRDDTVPAAAEGVLDNTTCSCFPWRSSIEDVSTTVTVTSDETVVEVEGRGVESTLAAAREAAGDAGMTLHEPRIPQEYLKSVVYGGLDVSLASLGVIASGAGGVAKTQNVIALGLANIVCGFVAFFYKIQDLHKEDRAKFQQDVGPSFWVNGTLSLLSFFVFGLLPVFSFGFSFRKSNDQDYKMAATVLVSVIAIALLGCGKVAAKMTELSYRRTVSTLITTGVVAAVGGYYAGEYISKLLEKYGIFSE